MNENYLEYDENANTGDESYCINEIVLGCQDDHYLEYNSNANIDDGSCSGQVCGEGTTLITIDITLDNF